MGSILESSEAWLELGLGSSIAEEERAVVELCIVKAEGAVKQFLRYDPVLARRTEYYPRHRRASGEAELVWETSGDRAFARELSGGSASELQLQRVPVRAVPAVEVRVDLNRPFGTVSGAFGPDTVWTEGVDYWVNYDAVDGSGANVCRDGLLRSFGAWPLSPGTVRVEYTAGYTSDEFRGGGGGLDASPIWAAVLEETKRRVEQVMTRRKKQSIGWVAGLLSSERLGDYSYSADTSLARALYGNTAMLSDEAMALLQPFVNMGWGD